MLQLHITNGHAKYIVSTSKEAIKMKVDGKRTLETEVNKFVSSFRTTPTCKSNSDPFTKVNLGYGN